MAKLMCLRFKSMNDIHSYESHCRVHSLLPPKSDLNFHEVLNENLQSVNV